jgi:hypothetical protein
MTTFERYHASYVSTHENVSEAQEEKVAAEEQLEFDTIEKVLANGELGPKGVKVVSKFFEKLQKLDTSDAAKIMELVKLARSNKDIHRSIIRATELGIWESPAFQGTFSQPAAHIAKWHLLDAICKEIGGVFVGPTGFSNLPVLFGKSFAPGNDAIHQKLSQLLHTWEMSKLFPLEVIDVLKAKEQAILNPRSPPASQIHRAGVLWSKVRGVPPQLLQHLMSPEYVRYKDNAELELQKANGEAPTKNAVAGALAAAALKGSGPIFNDTEKSPDTIRAMHSSELQEPEEQEPEPEPEPVGDQEEVQLRAIWGAVDEDGSGSLDQAEVGQVFDLMGKTLEPKKLHAAFKAMDRDGGGEIEFAELLGWWRKQSKGFWKAKDAISKGELEAAVKRAEEQAAAKLAAAEAAAGAERREGLGLPWDATDADCEQVRPALRLGA